MIKTRVRIQGYRKFELNGQSIILNQNRFFVPSLLNSNPLLGLIGLLMLMYCVGAC